jgi:cardiolipin synthase
MRLIGGFNITDQYFGRRGDQSWEDLGIVIPVPRSARIRAYAELFELSADGGVRLLALRRLIRDLAAGKWPAALAGRRPDQPHLSPWALALKRDLQNAQSIDIAAAYFSPTQSILRGCASAAARAGSAAGPRWQDRQWRDHRRRAHPLWLSAQT